MKLNKKSILISYTILIITLSINSSIFASTIKLNNHINSSEDIVLITGFGPFLSYEINPSQLITESLNGTIIKNATIIGVILPVDFDKSVEKITNVINYYNPSIVISTGLAPNKNKIEIEKIGINLKSYQIDDIRWSFPHRINKNGPFLHFSTFPSKEIVIKLKENEIASRLSYSAGTYVCNAVLYNTLGYIKENDLAINAGFIHVPNLKSEDPNGIELETMITAVTLAIETSLRLMKDQQYAAY